MRWILALVLLLSASSAQAQLEALEDDTPPDLVEKSDKAAKPSSPVPAPKAAVAAPKVIAQAPTKTIAVAPAAAAKPVTAPTAVSQKPVADAAPGQKQVAVAPQVKTAKVTPSQQCAKAPSHAPETRVQSTAYVQGGMSGEHANNLRHFKSLASTSSSQSQYNRTSAGVAARMNGPSRYVRPIHLNPGQTSPTARSNGSSRNCLARHAPTGGKLIAQSYTQPAPRQSSQVLRYSSHAGVVWTNNNQAQSYKTYR